MQIILVISDTHRKNLVFVTDTLKVFSLPEAVNAVQSGTIQYVHTAKTGAGTYLRSNPTAATKDNLNSIACSSFQLYEAIDGATFISRPGLREYWEAYSRSLEGLGLNKDAYIWIDGKRMTTKEEVLDILNKSKDYIYKAGESFAIDPYFLGAIIVDETARMAPFEEIRDAAAVFTLNWNVSVGVAQVGLQTARELVKGGNYNPNPKDANLSRDRIGKVSQQNLYRYVVQPKHSIFFAAALIRLFIDGWASAVDLRKRPEILATLYHLPYRKPHTYPEPDSRGLQIIEEFYPIAKGILLES